jgi:hypothetical protein
MINLDLIEIANSIRLFQLSPQNTGITIDEISLSSSEQSKPSLSIYISTIDSESSFVVWSTGEVETIIHHEDGNEAIETIDINSNDGVLKIFQEFITSISPNLEQSNS